MVRPALKSPRAVGHFFPAWPVPKSQPFSAIRDKRPGVLKKSANMSGSGVFVNLILRPRQ